MDGWYKFNVSAVTSLIEPKELGLAGAVQIARIDRQIGAKGKLNQTWMTASQTEAPLKAGKWLDTEQQRWGVENRTHHTLDVTHREDESRGRQPNAASVLGIFRRVADAFEQTPGHGGAPQGGTPPRCA